MTAMQESGLRNLDYGDRGSLGLFQQRPSMGWGTPDQVREPAYAASNPRLGPSRLPPPHAYGVSSHRVAASMATRADSDATSRCPSAATR